MKTKKTVCPNCKQWQDPDCLNECIKRGFAPDPAGYRPSNYGGCTAQCGCHVGRHCDCTPPATLAGDNI